MKKTVIDVQCGSHMQIIMPVSCIPVKVYRRILPLHACTPEADIEKNGFMIWRGVAGGEYGISALF